MKRSVQCAEQQVRPSNLTKYCTCHEKWLSWLIRVTYETSFTLRGATGITFQPHQILRLPRKMTLMIDVRHIWNVLYNARSNRTHPPTSPNTVPTTQNDTHDWCPSHMKRHLQCAEQQDSLSNLTKYCACHVKWLAWLMPVTFETSFTMRGATGITFQPHQILRLPRKIALQKSNGNLAKTFEASFTMADDSSMIRTWSDHEIAKLNPSVRRAYFSSLRNAFCIEKYNISRSGYLPRKSDTPRSPNIAPATKNDSHHWSSWHMKRHLHCAEQQVSSTNVTKYCSYHEKCLASLILMTYLNVIYNAQSIRTHPPTSPNIAPATQNCIPKSKRNLPKAFWSVIYNGGRFEHDPNMIRPWNCKTEPVRSQSLLFLPPQRILYWKIKRFALRLSTQFHQILRLLRKVTFQDQQMLRLPRKMTLVIDHRHIWNVIYLHCAEQQASPSNLTKYCACPVKWLSWLMSVTYETFFTMRGVTWLILQRHQILYLPRKMILMIDVRHIWNVIYNVQSNRTHSPTSPNIAPCHVKWLAWLMPVTYETSFAMRGATGITLQRYQTLHPPRKIAFQNLRDICRKQLKRHWQCATDSTMIRAWSEHRPSSRARPFDEVAFRASETHFVLKITTFRAPAIYPDFTKYSACHEKWPWNHQIVRLPRKVTLQDHQMLRLPRRVTLQDHQILGLPRKVTFQDHQMLRLPRKVTLQHYQILRLPHWTVTWLNCYFCTLTLLRCYFTELLLYWTVTWLELLLYWAVTLLSSSFTELLPYWAVTWLTCYLTELLLGWAVTLLNCYSTELLHYWAVTLLSCYFTELLLYWVVTLLSCYFTELLLCWAVTFLNCYFTALLLYWAVPLLSCYLTELLLDWPVTWLNCYLAELLLYWTVTLLSCYTTELLLYWAVTLLSCYFTELLLYWAVTLPSCYFAELLLSWTVTLLRCYFTELLLYWVVTWLSCYFTELLLYWAGLFAFWNLRNSEVSQLKFLWLNILHLFGF